MKTNRLLPKVVFLIVIFCSFSIFMGCNPSYSQVIKDDGYIKYSLNKGPVHFSFECINNYRQDQFYYSNENQYTTFLLSKRGFAWEPFDTYINILMNKDFNSINEALEEEQLYAQEPGKVLEISPIQISDISGILIVYLYKPGDTLQSPTRWLSTSSLLSLSYKPEPYISRKVFFIHNGFMCSIQIKSPENLADKAKADFDHIIQSFKILD